MEVLDTTDFIERELFTKEYVVEKNLDSSWPILTILGEKEGNSLRGRMKLAKELFLLMTNAAVELPFDFRKYPDGPYTKQIPRTVKNLEDEGLVERSKKERYKEYRIFEYNLTQKGKSIYEENIKKELENQKFILEAFKKLKDDTYRGSVLSDKCYGDFKLKKKNYSEDLWTTEREKWIEEIEGVIEDLLSTKFKKHVTRDFEYNLLMPVNYSKNIINEGELDPFNTNFQVKSGVVLYVIEEILKIVDSILKIVNSKKPESGNFEYVKCSLNRLDRFFYFLNQYSERYDIYPSLYNEDRDSHEFLTEGEKSRMKKMTAT